MARAMRLMTLITIAGTALGGSSSRNDATITVTEISSLNEITTSLELAADDIDRLALQLHGTNCG